MDDGLLIEQVEKFRHLYDKRNSLFKNKVARENAWKTIGEILEIEAPQCEQRWNVLRNKYAALKRQIKQTPSGSQAFTISWPYFDCMKFLDPYTLTRVKRISSVSQTNQSEQWSGVYEVMGSENIQDELDGSQNVIFEEEEVENVIPNSPETFQSQKRKKGNNEEKSPKKKCSKDTMAESVSVAFTSLSDSLTAYVAKKNDTRCVENSSDRTFAESIATDLSRVENFADKIYIKQQIYSVLYEYFSRLESDEM